jgi:predicted HTH transcriptional regulator
MTPERLQELIAAGESTDVEFKGEERSRLSDEDLVEAVVCLANRGADTPAWLLIGVEDDGRVTGARPRHEPGRTDPVRLTALIANRTRPSLTPRIEVVSCQGKEVIVVEVPPQSAPVGTTAGRYLRRALGGDGRPCCLPMFFHRLGAVHVQRHDDRIEISNPGGFPEGVRLDNLLVTAPRPRNPLLADAFKRAGIVERTARGIDTIFYEQLRNGRPAPSYDRSNESSVVVVLPGGQANLDFVRLVVEEARAGRNLGLDELLLLNALWQDRRLTTEEAARLTQKPESEVRVVLNRLVEAGLVEPRGERKGRTWHLSAATYRRLGQPAAYVRQRGFEPLQQEQMVLQYVEKHGRITRSEAAELCRLGSHQTTRLLGRLVQDGRLVRRGTRKGTYYVKSGGNKI